MMSRVTLLAWSCAVLATLACTGVQLPTYDHTLEIPGVQLPRSTGAVSMPAEAFLVAPITIQPGGRHERTPLPEELVDRCLAGEDVSANLPLQHAVVVVAEDRLEVAGQPLLQLEGGHIPAAVPRGPLISELFDALILQREATEALRQTGCVPLGAEVPLLVAIDERLPHDTLWKVAYTAGQAGYSTLALATEGPAAGPAPEPPVAAPPRRPSRDASVIVDQGGLTLAWPSSRVELTCAGPCRSVEAFPWGDAEEALRPEAEAHPREDLTVVAAPEAPVQVVARAMDMGRAAGFGRIAVGQAAGAAGELEPPLAREVSPGAYTPLDPVPVVLVTPLRPDWNLPPEPPPEPVGLSAMERAILEMGVIAVIGEKEGATGLDLLGGGGDPDVITRSEGGRLGGLGSGGASAHGGGTGHFGAAGASETAVLSTPEITGAISAEAVQRVVRRHSSQLRYCYQRRLVRDTSLAGVVTLKWVIAADGSVSSTTVLSSTLGDADVASCVEARYRRMRFPEVPGGGIAIVEQTITFSAE